MSGGALDYVHHQISDAAEKIHEKASSHEYILELEAFSGAVRKFANLMRAVDYHLSDDKMLGGSDLDCMRRVGRAMKGYTDDP